MKEEKRHVGRPTNEEVRERRNKILIKVFIPVVILFLIIFGLYIMTNPTASLNKTKGASSLVKDGWVNTKGKWYFYKKGEKQEGFRKIDGKWYYLSEGRHGFYGSKYNIDVLFEPGELVTGLFPISDSFYYFAPKSGYYGPKNNKVKRSKGEMVTGWVRNKNLNGNWLYFAPKDGTYNGEKYKKGQVLKGLQYLRKPTAKENDKKRYYYYFDDFSYNAIIDDFEGEYYFNKLGRMVTGWKKINNEIYYFAPKDGTYNGEKYKVGQRLKGFQYLRKPTAKENDKKTYRYFFNEHGVAQIDTWINNYYHSDKNGRIVTGWYKIGCDMYYFAPKTGVYNGKKYKEGYVISGWQKIDGKWYYFNEYGTMQTGWQDIKWKGEERTFYFKENGICIGKDEYPELGELVTSDCITKYKNKYCFDKNGIQITEEEFESKYNKTTTTTAKVPTPTKK